MFFDNGFFRINDISVFIGKLGIQYTCAAFIEGQLVFIDRNGIRTIVPCFHTIKAEGGDLLTVRIFFINGYIAFSCTNIAPVFNGHAQNSALAEIIDRNFAQAKACKAVFQLY